MLYKPKKGQIKDGCMIYESGTFYLFSMYRKENSDKFCHVWLATSADGVHFDDCGCVVEDFPAPIWAMKVYRGEDAYYMNSGSFNKSGKQVVLKFWKSHDLLHWEYLPQLDVEAPNPDDPKTRLDCMNVVKYGGTYYGYATGQHSFLTSKDGAHWNAFPANIKYDPFPEYNPALGGFEIADCVEIDGKFYLFCGGFGHLGVSGYGVYLYESEKPEGPFRPCLPHYRINGTSKRWVNMWERFFEKDGQYLANNYMYNGYSYENGSVFLPPLKRLVRTDAKMCLQWWEGNGALYGALCAKSELLLSESPAYSVFDETEGECALSEPLAVPDAFVAEMNLTLSENTFTEYSCGGIYLAEDDKFGCAILFDTYGKCEIAHIKESKIHSVEDRIGFGSTAPYWLEAGKPYQIRILSKGGMFEIYVNDLYLQTFNNAHLPGSTAKAFMSVGAISCRKSCTLRDIKIYHMNGSGN